MVSRSARGFTLIELLIAMALMFVALVGMLALQIIALRANGQARSITEATVLAQDKLETLEHTPFALLSSTGSVVEPQLGPQGTGVPNGAYTRTTTTTRGATQATIAVRVGWTGADGRAHAITVNTLRTP